MRNLYIAYVIALAATFGAIQYGPTISAYVSKGWDKAVNAVAERLPESTGSATMRKANGGTDSGSGSTTPTSDKQPLQPGANTIDTGTSPVGSLALPFAALLIGYGTVALRRKE